MTSINYPIILGCLAALGSAATFAFCSILLQKLSSSLSPLGANFWKCLAGSLLLLIALLFFGFGEISFRAMIFLILSGLLGIALADTFFFKSLVLLGPRVTLLLETISPIFTIVLAIIFLKEQPSFSTWSGILLILSGVTWVLWEQNPEGPSVKKQKQGILYALSFCLCMSIGIILTKVGVTNISALQATFIRLSSSFFFLFFYGIFSKNLFTWITPMKDPKLIKLGTAALFLAVFGGFWLSTVALKFIDASVATVLNSTTPLFILPMVAFFTKEKISLKAVVGAMIAVCGIALIFIK